MKRLFHQICFTIRIKWAVRLSGNLRSYFYRFLGMQIGKNTLLPPVFVNWPQKVYLGNNCRLERDIYFKFDGIWSEKRAITVRDEVFIGSGCEFNISKGIEIGRFSNVASGCKFIDHDHGIRPGTRIGPQPSVSEMIVLGEDVWLGCNVIVLKGVHIGDGAVVAAGAVVTKSIPASEIWAGVPARKISERARHGEKENHFAHFRG